jgi:quercetin dioxygenase-like cupin family protein
VVASETHVLRVGDAMLFPADRDHAYRNEAGEPVRFEMVVIVPAGSDAPT